MGVSLSEILADTNRWLLTNDAQSLAILSTSDREDIIRSAVRQYSRRRPYLILQAYTSVSDNWYDLPDSWEDGFSRIQEIEYPIENTPPNRIDEIDYFISLMSDGKKIRFIRNNPTTGNTFWVKYQIRHAFDSAEASDIPEDDRTVLSYLCISLFCDALATHFASKADPSLPEAQLLEYTSRVDEYSKKAREWMKRFKDEFQDEDTGTYGEIGFTQDNFWDRSND